MLKHQECLQESESFKKYLLGLLPAITIISIAIPLLAFLALRAIENYTAKQQLQSPQAKLYTLQLQAVGR